MDSTKKHFFLKTLAWVLPASLAAGAVFASFSPGAWWIGWLSFSFLFLVGGMGLVACWRWAGGGRTLAWITALALILRAGLGLGLTLVLPASGYDTETQRAGYVYYDAFRRDGQAWQLAQSGRPLWHVFESKSYVSDQYGGLLFISAGLYRLLSPDTHRPLLVSLLAALTASFSIPLLWKAAARKWGEAIARPAAWIVALFPEGILLAGSQMREPFLITYSALVLWGLVSLQEDRNWQGWLWLLGGFTGMLLFSPGIILITMVILAGWLWFSRVHRPLRWWVWALVAGIAVVGLLVVSASWSGVVENPTSGPLGVIAQWFDRTIKSSWKETRIGSGPMEFLFEAIPYFWVRKVVLVVYGILQPVLPAVIFDLEANPLWRVIGTLRGLGWYVILPGLVYGLVAAARQGRSPNRNLWVWIGLIAWIWILIASLRAGGDQWDNPRYRAILLVWQALFIAQAWQYARLHPDRWLGRILTVEAVFVLIFCNWYAYRVYKLVFPLGIHNSVLISVVLALLIPLADWAWVGWIKPSLTRRREGL